MDVDVRIDISDIHMDIDTAIPCGLLINEVISNSLKHAFRDTAEGIISISMKETDQGAMTLTIADNGCGMPEYVEMHDTDSLGMQLIATLAEEQLGGIVDLNRQDGTKYTITFRIPHE